MLADNREMKTNILRLCSVKFDKFTSSMYVFAIIHPTTGTSVSLKMTQHLVNIILCNIL